MSQEQEYMDSSKQLLNIDQTPTELSKLYGPDDFYWYLRSQPFIDTFIIPIANLVNNYATSCLDVGCGEGRLAQYVTVPYTGIDGSNTAIERAKRYRDLSKYNHSIDFIQARFEDPPYMGNQDIIVFGGILEVLIKPQHRVDFINIYKQFMPRHFIVYDLERLDTSLIEAHFGPPIVEIHASVQLDIIEAKKHRKVLLFKC